MYHCIRNDCIRHPYSECGISTHPKKSISNADLRSVKHVFCAGWLDVGQSGFDSMSCMSCGCVGEKEVLKRERNHMLVIERLMLAFALSVPFNGGRLEVL